MTYIRWFAQLNRTEVSAAGGKGANLGDMAQAGLPVPPGFVLLTDAYRAFVAAAGIQPEVERLAATARADDPDSVEAASAAIRHLFDQGAVPAPIAEAVIHAYRELGQGRVAVRSSATAEDLPGASFAGQQETYLNIEGEARVLQAVQRCWSSLWTGRAIAYRLRQGIAPGDVALAVVIQRQVEAEAAGILFTANPVNGRRDQMVIDGAWGLGEAVVSGQVTPDRWVADGATGAVLESHPGRKLAMTVRKEGVTATVPVPEHLQDQPSLTATQVTALVQMGRRVAEHFGAPQDIEWALAEGVFYLVQSRPITSLYPMPMPATGKGLRIYISFHVLQGLVEPFTPMGIDLFRHIARGPGRLLGYPPPPGKPPAAFNWAAGRIFLDITDALKNKHTRKFLRFLPPLLDQPTGRIIEMLLEREPSIAVESDHFPIRPPIGVVLRMFP
ncbi:MAG TPA: PEP/pyruvate-binding domain-containing protein, partial [Symbiobacteriaceae bacterium]|nr:PEP/pyruvate-binding domain-containing protein [Symbiobacteriaceae bacterium]